MNLTELQILFQQKIQDTNPVFEVEQRPDSYSIANYLNKAINRYLEKKYLSLPTFQQRLSAIDMNVDELHMLIKANGEMSSEKYLSEYNWSTRGHRYRAPDDVLLPISLSCTVTRSEIYPMSAQVVFADWMSRRQAERIVSNTSDKVMYPKPIAVWENPYYIMVIVDAYTTSVTAGFLNYLKKPFKLDFSYAELEAVGNGNLDITSITNNTDFLTKSNITYVNAGGSPTVYKAGEKVTKQTGYNTITYLDEHIIVGYPWGYTDKPEFPEYLHDSLVELAVTAFLDEAKFRLIPQKTT